MLFALSGNRCAFPRCQNHLIERGVVVGEMCHIEAKEAGGPRYNEQQTKEEREAFENFILMCAIHHKVIDTKPDEYPVPMLLDWKAEHEGGVAADSTVGRRPLTADQVHQFMQTTSIVHAVTSINQQGGQTAYHITNVYHEPAKAPQPSLVPVVSLKKLLDPLGQFWALIAGFLGAVTTVYKFVQLLEGDRETVTWIICSAGYLVLVIALLLVSFGKTSSSINPNHRIYQYPRGRKLAFGSFLLLVIVTVVAGGWLYKKDLELRKKIVVLVTNLDGPDPKKYRVTELLLSKLRHSLGGYNDTVIVSLNEVITEQEGSERARSIAKRYHPDLVIWGWYGATGSDVLVNVHVENLTGSKFIPLQMNDALSQQADVSELNSFQLQQRLSSELTALTLFVSGFVRLEANDYQETIRRLSAALNSSDWPEGLVPRADALFFRGSAYLLTESYDIAALDFTEVIKSEPDFAGAYNNRGVAYINLNKSKEAGDDFSKAIEIQPDFADAYDNRGLLNQSIGDLPKAIDDHTHAIQINPQFFDAYYNRGRAYDAKGEEQKAIDDYTQAIRLDPSKTRSYVSRGIAYSKLSDYQRAIADYSEAIKLNPQHDTAYYNRGNAYGLTGDRIKSIADYTAAITINPRFAMAYKNRASAYEALGNDNNCVADLSKAIELNPKDEDAFAKRGLAYLLMKDYRKAVEDLSVAITLKQQKDYELLYSRAIALRELNEVQRQMQDLNAVIAINPKFASALRDRGAIYTQFGETTKALADFASALSFNQRDPETYFNRGVLYRSLKDNLKAIEDFSKAIQLNPKDDAALNNRANAYKDLGQMDKAVADYSQAIQMNPSNAQFYYNRAVSYRIVGDNRRALLDLSTSIQLNPTFPEVYTERGATYAEMKDFENAFADYGRAIDLNPRFAQAYYNRAIDFIYLEEFGQAQSDLQRVIAISNDPDLQGKAQKKLRELVVNRQTP